MRHRFESPLPARDAALPPLPPTDVPVVRSLPPADCRCPSPLPCPRSASYPTPPESCDSSGIRLAAPLRSTSSRSALPSRAAPAWPQTPAARSSASAPLPSPVPRLPSNADRISSAPPPRQNSPPRKPVRTAGSPPDWEARIGVRYPGNTGRQSLHPETTAPDSVPYTRTGCRDPQSPDRHDRRQTACLAENACPSWPLLPGPPRPFLHCHLRRCLALQLLPLRQTH